jgi:hypothetical protein
LLVERLPIQFAGGIAQVPSQAIHAGVHVARRTRHVAQAGSAPGVVKMTTSRRDA